MYISYNLSGGALNLTFCWMVFMPTSLQTQLLIPGLARTLFILFRFSLSRRDQTPQTVLDVISPTSGTPVKTIQGRNQAPVDKAEFGFLSPGEYLKNHL